MSTCVITGANSGIGRSAAFQIAAKGWTVVMACRDAGRAQAACEEIRTATGNPEVHVLPVDLSLLSSVRAFAEAYGRRFPTLDVLIQNAADFDLRRKKAAITAEGNETQFATNVLAPFALEQLLLPLLEASADGRILHISSQGLMLYPNLAFDFDNVKGEKRYDPAATYYQTKLALLMNALTLRERLAGTRVSVHAVRVTNVKIDLSRYDGISPFQKFLYGIKSRFSIAPEEMARVYTELATGEKRTGFYYDERMNEVKANRHAYDAAGRERLWSLCLDALQGP